MSRPTPRRIRTFPRIHEYFYPVASEPEHGFAVSEAARSLVQWFRAAARTLPWRTDQGAWGLSLLEEPRPVAFAPSVPAGGKDPEPSPRRDPYRTWIAEVMLQQTQVATVLGHYRRWMESFPDIETLAAAREEDVLAHWAGLGYYSRARNILATARQVAASHGGRFPRSREGLLGLKGIGEYTAGAIASLAFDLPEPILDGNLVRVFSRVYGLAFLPDTAAHRQAYWDLARRWVEAPVDGSGDGGAAPRGRRVPRPGLVNEGLMELGALVCTPRNPDCVRCPLGRFCRARAEGRQEELPPAKRRKDAKTIRGFAAVVRRGGEALLYRPPKGELLAGLLTFPVFPMDETPTLAALRKAWAARLPGLPVPAFRQRSATVSHSITHHQIRLCLAEGELPPAGGGLTSSCGELPEGYVWVTEDHLEATLVSSFPRKILAASRGETGRSDREDA